MVPLWPRVEVLGYGCARSSSSFCTTRRRLPSEQEGRNAKTADPRGVRGSVALPKRVDRAGDQPKRAFLLR